jgi:hypothetical protein
MRRVSAHCRAGMRPAASASPKAAGPRASGAMDEPDDPPSMLGDTGQLTSAKSAPDSARCHARLPRRPCQCSAPPAAQLSVGRRRRRGAVACERPVTPEESCTSESAARIFGTSRSACFCSILRCSLAPRCAAWASSSSTCCTAKGSAHPSLRPTERGWPRRMPPLDLWALLGPRVTAAASMRSAHTAAFPDRIGMRSIFSCRTTRPSAARKASAPTSGARPAHRASR